MERISTKNAPTPAGHYSQAIVHNGLVFVSGQLAIEPETGKPVTNSIESQTERCLRNVEAVLLAAGSDLNHVLKFTVYVSDESLWSAVNETYARILGEHRPARAIIPVGKFRGDFLIEIEAVAAVNN
ncbi:MAG: Rid family detoxifying hydrolase [Pyrinomonadaceae bacterium]